MTALLMQALKEESAQIASLTASAGTKTARRTVAVNDVSSSTMPRVETHAQLGWLS